MQEMKRCDRTVAVLNLSSCLRDGQKGRAPAAPEKPGRSDAPPAFPLRVFPVYCPLSSCFFFSLL